MSRSIITGRLPQRPGDVYDEIVGIVRSLGFIVAPFVLAGLTAVGPTACGQISDPAVPCDRIALGEAAAGTVDAHADSPVLAISDTPRPFVVHPVCDEQACRWERTFLAGNPDTGNATDTALSGGSELLLTSNGRWVVAIDRPSQGNPELRSWRIDPWADAPVREHARQPIADGDAVTLVAGLRNSDTIVVRNRDLELGSIDPRNLTFEPMASTRPALKVVAVGDHHIVGREIIDGEDERVVLVPVTSDTPNFSDGAVELATLPALSRVELTADDEFVMLVGGEGDDAETFMFSVDDGVLVDRFIGGAVNGARRLDTLPGMHAVSPDGSHLAYRTASGALALRDLAASSSCLVRSASGGDHSVAGFVADAMLYLQADHGQGESHVFAFDTHSRTLTPLDAGSRGHHLVAAPPRLAERGRPWAVGVRDGSYRALQEGAEAVGLGLDGPVFVPRGDGNSALWLADRYQVENQTRIGLRRFMPESAGGTYRFDRADDVASVPEIFAAGGSTTPLGATLSRLSTGERPCLSTGTPGGWGFQCGTAGATDGFLATAPMPASELRDPELPDPE